MAFLTKAMMILTTFTPVKYLYSSFFSHHGLRFSSSEDYQERKLIQIVQSCVLYLMIWGYERKREKEREEESEDCKNGSREIAGTYFDGTFSQVLYTLRGVCMLCMWVSVYCSLHLVSSHLPLEAKRKVRNWVKHHAIYVSKEIRSIIDSDSGIFSIARTAPSYINVSKELFSKVP